MKKGRFFRYSEDPVAKVALTSVKNAGRSCRVRYLVGYAT